MGVNPAKFDGVEDMGELGHLNEPAVLYNLTKRYDVDLFHVRINVSKYYISYILIEHRFTHSMIYLYIDVFWLVLGSGESLQETADLYQGDSRYL